MTERNDAGDVGKIGGSLTKLTELPYGPGMPPPQDIPQIIENSYLNTCT